MKYHITVDRMDGCGDVNDDGENADFSRKADAVKAAALLAKDHPGFHWVVRDEIGSEIARIHTDDNPEPPPEELEMAVEEATGKPFRPTRCLPPSLTPPPAPANGCESPPKPVRFQSRK